jgi:phospholipid/cholesterol/gamma-HCH transport system permease protein
VIAPKLIAVLIAFPCLTMLADIAGLLGGTFTSAVFLNMPVRIFLNQAFEHIKPSDLGMGLYKSLIFACLVGGVGCLCGMHVRYGATSVGRATTQAAVSGIFLTVIANALITMSGYML